MVPGYQVGETCYESDRTLVYRGQREADAMPVILKLLKREHPTLAEQARFRNQYAMLQALDLPGVIQPIALEIYQNRLAIIMPDEGLISLRNFLPLPSPSPPPSPSSLSSPSPSPNFSRSPSNWQTSWTDSISSASSTKTSNPATS